MHTPASHHYKTYRFPGEIICHDVWLCSRFCRSDRDVEKQFVGRGLMGTDEASRKWCRAFGPQYANQLRHGHPGPATHGTWVKCSSHPRRTALSLCG
jgi:putative transposase